MASVWGENMLLFFFFLQRGATFSASVHDGGAPRLRVGPGASWTTSVGPSNWASSPHSEKKKQKKTPF